MLSSSASDPPNAKIHVRGGPQKLILRETVTLRKEMIDRVAKRKARLRKRFAFFVGHWQLGAVPSIVANRPVEAESKIPILPPVPLNSTLAARDGVDNSGRPLAGAIIGGGIHINGTPYATSKPGRITEIDR
jgi:hypothetical protein